MSAKAQVEALLDAGVNEPDAMLAQRVGCAASTVKAYRQEWQRRHGVHTQHLQIPSAVEVELIALRNDGFTFPVIVEILHEQFGIRLTVPQAWTVYRSGGSISVPTPVPAEVDADDLPLATCSGTMWRLPFKPPRNGRNKQGWSTCDVCPLREQCERSLTDPLWYNGCERPLAWEVAQIGDYSSQEDKRDDGDIQ